MFTLNSFTTPLPVAGITLGASGAGIKHRERDDLAVIALDQDASVAAVFTRNLFCAAPVALARVNLASATPRFLLLNSGNANAGTGERGRADAARCCEALARLMGCALAEVLPFSTGVIGEPLPVDKITAALPRALASLSAAGWDAAARAIMTTDTVPKYASCTTTIDGVCYTVTGIAKGAGMIRPDMATMLAFVASDANISSAALQTLVTDVCERTFNRITIDGDTSTNDACVFMASGATGVAPIGLDHAHWPGLAAAYEQVCAELAKAIVRDGEGATRLVAVEVGGGASTEDCSKVAYAIAESPLVKTALFAGDPNWGRILAAIGRCGAAGLDLGQVSIHLDDYCIVAGGERVEHYSEARAAEVMAAREFTIRVVIGPGPATTRVWTCDFSYDYVRINAGYRS